MITKESYMRRLANIQNQGMIAVQTVMPGTEPRFIIDADKRTITIPPEFTFLAIKGDHNAETIYFEIDRYFDGHDLSEETCIVQYKMTTNDGLDAGEGIYHVTEIDTVSEPGKIVFGWTIKNSVTSTAANVSFSIRFYSIEDVGTISSVFKYNFNTLEASLPILDTLNTNEFSFDYTAEEVQTLTATFDDAVKKANISAETAGKYAANAAISAKQAADAVAKLNNNDESAGSDTAAIGYTNIFSVKGENNSEKFWNAMNAGGRYAGSKKEFKIDYGCCTPGSTEMQYVKWWIAYRDTYPELTDGVDVVFKDIVFEPEGEKPILLQFLYKSGSITFENCTFRNLSFWFGRDYKQVITFRNCLIEDNQYHFLTTGEWNQNAEYHIEGCHFRHMRPNFEEYRADVKALKLNGWAHGNIRSLGFNIKWFFKDTVFEDCMAQLNIMIQKSSHVPEVSPKYVEFYMERCTIQKTNGAGLSFSGQPVTGYIRDCKFYNIGANRCNEEGYDLPTDKNIQFGSGTEEDPYVYACGVGANAIFSYNWTPRHELVISNNWMYNMMENGVEGNYRELSYNHIENTGYRMDEGMWNPSTEGIYGNFAVCKGNVIRNPYKNEAGIVIPSWSDGQACYYEDNIIEYDKDGGTNSSTGFEIMFQAQEWDYPCYIRNNDIHGFAKKFSVYNQYSASLANLHIYDIGERDNVLSSSDMGQRMLMGADWTSTEAKEIVRDPYFYELNEDGSPKEWHLLHGEGGVYTTGTDRYLRIKGNSLSACAVIAQDYHLNSDLYIARIRCQVRTESGKIGFCPISLNDDGSMMADADYKIMHPNLWNVDLKTEGDPNQFIEVTHSMVVSQNCRICIVDPNIDDAEDAEYRSKMDVKNISVLLTRIQRSTAVSENEALAVPGKLYDFSNITSVYLPANAFTVTYWIPQKDFSYGGSWTDACWMMGKYTAEDEGRGRVVINQDTKQYGQFTVWYKSHFDVELNGHTLECANLDTYSFLALFNGADVHIKGPGTIKAKNFAVAVGYGCTLTVDPDVVIESTGVNDNGESRFAMVVGAGDAAARTVLNVHGGSIGKVLSYAYTDINFELAEGAEFKMERLQTKGKIFVAKDTKVINGGTDPETEVTNPKHMTGLFTSTKLRGEHAAGHTEDDLIVYGDESLVTYRYTDENGELVEGESSLSDAFSTANTTRETRQGAFAATLQTDIYTYTGLWFGDSGVMTLDLNGHSIRNEYQSYALNLNGETELTIMDSNSTVEGIGTIESTNYAAVIANGITLHIGRCLLRQSTGICVTGYGTITLEDEAQLEGKIGINAGTDTSVVLNGGTIRATNIGVQASPQDESSTIVIVHGGVVASDNNTIYAKNVLFDIDEGKTATLSGSLSLSQNAEIASGTQVFRDGEPVTELRNYTGTITAKRENSDEKPTVIPVSGLSLDKSEIVMNEGDVAVLTAIVEPDNATDKTITWELSPNGYCKVENGIITAIRAGCCTVIATACGRTATCKVIVKAVTPAPSDTAVYKLPEAKQFLPANKEFIDTGVKLFEDVSAKPTWTILLDANDFGRIQQQGNSYMLAHCMTEVDPYPGFCLQVIPSGNLQLCLFDSRSTLAYVAGQTYWRMQRYIQIKGTQYRTGWDPENDEWADISGYTTNVPQTLLLGCYQDADGTKGRFWDGTIKRFEVWNKELTSEEVLAWFAKE